MATSQSYGESVKLRERFQSAGFSQAQAQQAVQIVMDWAGELGSQGHRNHMPEAKKIHDYIKREESSISPNAADVEGPNYSAVSDELSSQSTQAKSTTMTGTPPTNT